MRGNIGAEIDVIKPALPAQIHAPIAIHFAFGQLSMCFVESNGAFDVSAAIQNTNLTGAEARSGFGIVDGLTLLPGTQVQHPGPQKLSSPLRVGFRWDGRALLPSLQQPCEGAAPEPRPRKVLQGSQKLPHRVRSGALLDRLVR
jgi:hypothetical protein